VVHGRKDTPTHTQEWVVPGHTLALPFGSSV
jgi:hypothetical protein